MQSVAAVATYVSSLDCPYIRHPGTIVSFTPPPGSRTSIHPSIRLRNFGGRTREHGVWRKGVWRSAVPSADRRCASPPRGNVGPASSPISSSFPPVSILWSGGLNLPGGPGHRVWQTGDRHRQFGRRVGACHIVRSEVPPPPRLGRAAIIGVAFYPSIDSAKQPQTVQKAPHRCQEDWPRPAAVSTPAACLVSSCSYADMACGPQIASLKWRAILVGGGGDGPALSRATTRASARFHQPSLYCPARPETIPKPIGYALDDVMHARLPKGCWHRCCSSAVRQTRGCGAPRNPRLLHSSPRRRH